MELSTTELSRRRERACLDLDIVIVGAKKAGTSTLLDHLLRGRGVAPLHRSEMPYFSEEEEFGRGPEVAIRKYFGEEASPDAVRVGKDFLLNVPSAIPRMLEDSPRARLVAVLREPVARAYSSFWFARRRGFEPEESFAAAVERELRGERSDLPRQDLREHVAAGEYARQLEEVFARVDRDRVEVFLLEELHADPRGIANRLLAPLGTGIPADAAAPERSNSSARPRSAVLARIGASPRVRSLARPLLSPALRGSAERLIRRVNDVPFEPPPLEPEVGRRLAAHFDPQIEALEALIDRDLTAWRTRWR